MDEVALKAKALELAILFFGTFPPEMREALIRHDSDGAIKYDLKILVSIADGFINEYIKKL